MEKYKLRFSYLAEQYARYKLAEYYSVDPKQILHATEINPTCPWDLEYLDNKYDVKYSSPTFCHPGRNTYDWDFDLRNKVYKDCNYLILVGAKNGTFRSTFLVPISEVENRRRIRVSVDGHSKWHVYKI